MFPSKASFDDRSISSFIHLPIAEFAANLEERSEATMISEYIVFHRVYFDNLDDGAEIILRRDEVNLLHFPFIRNGQEASAISNHQPR
jgi:hypothetical protein